MRFGIETLRRERGTILGSCKARGLSFTSASSIGDEETIKDLRSPSWCVCLSVWLNRDIYIFAHERECRSLTEIESRDAVFSQPSPSPYFRDSQLASSVLASCRRSSSDDDDDDEEGRLFAKLYRRGTRRRRGATQTRGTKIKRDVIIIESCFLFDSFCVKIRL